MSGKTTKGDRTVPTTNLNPLSSWVAMNEALKTISEEECWALLEEEKKGQQRVQFMLRIHGRANKLRAERERRELLGGE